MKKQSVEFWQHIILSGKTIEPQTKEQQAAYDIAEFFVKREDNKLAA